MVVAEGPQILDVRQCIWRRIFVSLEKISVLSILRQHFIQFLHEIYMEENLQEFFLDIFFRYPYHSNGCKTHLDVALFSGRGINLWQWGDKKLGRFSASEGDSPYLFPTRGENPGMYVCMYVCM